MNCLNKYKMNLPHRGEVLKLILTAAVSVAVFTSASAQRRNSMQFVSADFGGGLQSIQYKPVDGSRKGGAGMTFNVGYRYFFTDNWAVSTGLGVSTYSAKTKYNDTYESTPSYDSINQLNYEFRTYFDGFLEKQKAMVLEIPIQAYYEYPISQRRFEVFGKAGFKIGFPVSSKYKLMKGSYETRGYYPYLGHEIYSSVDGEYVHGFGVYETDSQKGKMKLNPVNFSLAIEGGANYRFNKLMRFTAALYFSYCLTNLHKDSMQPILTEEYEYKGTMQSNQIDHASLLSLGLKAGVVLDVNELFSSKAARRPKF